MSLDIDAAQAQLGAFAPWVKELDIRIESVSDAGARLRMPYSERLCRVDGIVCGQALMTLVDTCSVFVCWGVFGDFQNVTTVDQNTSFLRPVKGADVIAEGRARKSGRTLVFPEVHLYAAGDERAVAHGTSTFAVLPGTLPAL